MISYIPENWTQAILPNKENINTFVNSVFQQETFNIALCGNLCVSKIIKDEIVRRFTMYSHYNYKKIVYKCNFFDEISIQNYNNELNIFCQNNIDHHKLVIIDDFDEFTDNQQQMIKIFIDKYNLMRKEHKVFFLISTSSKFYIKDILMSRLKCFEIQDFSKSELKRIAEFMCKQHNITLSETNIDAIMNIFNISLDNISCILQKVKLLNPEKNNDTQLSMHELLGLIDYNLFDGFFDKIMLGEFRSSYNVLDEIYIKGYDIGDIFYFMYQYLKCKVQSLDINEKNENTINYHKVIERVCFHINELYNGHNDRSMLIFFTLDIFEIYNPNIELDKLLL